MHDIHHRVVEPESRSGRWSARRAFTLVELMIVIVILGILATVVVPQFSNASHEARENMLKDDLRYLRTQVAVYKAQHRDVPPGHPGGDTSAAATAVDFLSQMTSYTAEDCSTSATFDPTHRFGPYLSKMPQNPLNGKDTITVSTVEPVVPDDSTGWFYNPNTLAVTANLTGSDKNGTPYKDY